MVVTAKEKLLQAYHGWSPWVLPSVLQSLGWPCQRLIWPQMSAKLRLSNVKGCFNVKEYTLQTRGIHAVGSGQEHSVGVQRAEKGPSSERSTVLRGLGPKPPAGIPHPPPRHSRTPVSPPKSLLQGLTLGPGPATLPPESGLQSPLRTPKGQSRCHRGVSRVPDHWLPGELAAKVLPLSCHMRTKRKKSHPNREAARQGGRCLPVFWETEAGQLQVSAHPAQLSNSGRPRVQKKG